MEYNERRPGLPLLAGALALILVALLVVAGLKPWDHRVSVRFVSYGGGAIEPLQVQPGASLEQSRLPKAQRSDRRFVGWCLDEEATRLYSGEPIREDTALYAAYAVPADFHYTGLRQVFLGDVGRDFGLVVASEEPLNGENLSRFVLLTTFYGGQATLTVAAAGEGLYRLTANFAESSSYQLQLLSSQVRFADPALEKRGVGPMARMIAFTVPGSNVTDVIVQDSVLYVPSENLLSAGDMAICVKGTNPYKVGQVLRLPSGEDHNYYAVERLIYDWEAGQLGLRVPQDVPYTCYRLRHAETGEVLSKLEVRLRKQLLAEQMLDPQKLQEQIQTALEGDWTANALTDLMITAAQNTEQYKQFSNAQLGTVVQALPAARNAQTVVRVGVSTNEKDLRYFSDMALYTPEDTKFHNITIQLKKEVAVENDQGQMLLLEAGLHVTVGLHVHVDVAASGGEVVAFDASVTTLTHTQAEAGVQVRSADGQYSLHFGGTYDSMLDEAVQDAQADFFADYARVLGSANMTLLDLQVAEATYAAGPLEITLPVRLRLDAQLLGALRGELDLKTGSVAGIRGDTETGFYSYQYDAEPSMKLKQMAQGHSGFRVLADFDAQVRFAGLESLGSLQLQGQSGGWSDTYGYHYLDYYHMGDAQTQEALGGYYARLGLFRKVASQATVLKKQFEDTSHDPVQVLARLGDRLTVVGLESTETLKLGGGGLRLGQLEAQRQYIDLLTGRYGTGAADAKGMTITVSGPFRLEGQRVLYTGKDKTAEGFLQITCSGSSGAFYNGVTARIPIRYEADGAAMPEQKPAACTYSFHVLDENGQAQVATVTVPAGVLPRVEHLTVAPEGLRFAGWYDGAVEILTQVQPGVTEYYARYEKE